jgi:hypothetical protein
MGAPLGNQYALGNEGGRPTTYKPEYPELARKLCMLKLGVIDKDLAEFFEVDVQTIYDWKNKYQEFAYAIKEGKINSDLNVAESLYRRATGYSHPAVKMFNNNGEIIQADYTEHYPPDPTSMIFWLKNRQREHWRDKHELELINPKEKLAEILGCSVEELPELSIESGESEKG